MPLPNFPPTPASSTELLAQDKLRRPSVDNGFTLPPPALQDADDNLRARIGSIHSSNSMPSPEQKSRGRRTSTSKNSSQPLHLPPPPSRSRKIIQMKPKGSQASSDNAAYSPTKGRPDPVPIAGTKRKQASSTSVAGRKIARKTAHSLIERRRRSKMNEEFATLKDMVPACRGHEMHKLAILQASIDYLRYLQDCIGDLKDAANPPPERRASTPGETPTSPAFSALSGSAMSTPYLSPAMEPRQSESQNPSPTLTAEQYNVGNESMEMSSPQISPKQRPEKAGHSRQASQLNSPMTNPDDEMDIDPDQNEATAALLMLNRDRRVTGPSPIIAAQDSPGLEPRSAVSSRASGTSSKGMSVRELLSS